NKGKDNSNCAPPPLPSFPLPFSFPPLSPFSFLFFPLPPSFSLLPSSFLSSFLPSPFSPLPSLLSLPPPLSFLPFLSPF
ncbi:hypothetical protein ACXWR7_13070, partial [Streptococcus pyogenes]